MTLDVEVERRKALERLWAGVERMYVKSSAKLAPPIDESVSESGQSDSKPSDSKSASANSNASSVSSSGVLIESVSESSSPSLELRVREKNVLPKNDVLYVIAACNESAVGLVKRGNVDGAVRAYVDGFDEVRSRLRKCGNVLLSDKDFSVLDECAVGFERCLSKSKYAVGFASWYRGLVDFEAGAVFLDYDEVRKSLPCFAQGYARVRRALRKGFVLCEEDEVLLNRYVGDFAHAWSELKEPEYAMKVYRRFGRLLLENGCFDGAERAFLSSVSIAEDQVGATGKPVLSCDKENEYVGKIRAFRAMRNVMRNPNLLLDSSTADEVFSIIPIYSIADTVDAYISDTFDAYINEYSAYINAYSFEDGELDE